MSDAWSYLPGTTGDAWSRMCGTSGDAWSRLAGTVGDAWSRLIVACGPPVQLEILAEMQKIEIAFGIGIN